MYIKEKSAKVLSCFLSISRAIAGQVEFNEILKVFGTKLQELIPHTHLDIVILQENGYHDYFEFGVVTDWNVGKSTRVVTKNSPIRELLNGNLDHILCSDARVDKVFNFAGAENIPITDSKLHARIVVPLRVQGTIIGSMSISHREPNLYIEETLAIAKDTADLFSPYLFSIVQSDRAERSAREAIKAKIRQNTVRMESLFLSEGAERERQRIGMDLHDQILADLSGTSRNISSLASNASIVADDLIPIQADLDVCLVELRNVIEDLKPGILQMFGFSEAVEALLVRGISRRKLHIDFSVKDYSDGLVDDLPDVVRTSIFRMVQEAINNALKHSNSKHINLMIKNIGSKVFIVVADDGIGFDIDFVEKNRGLENIRVRADLLSATLTILSGENHKGTEIQIEYDLKTLNNFS